MTARRIGIGALLLLAAAHCLAVGGCGARDEAAPPPGEAPAATSRAPVSPALGRPSPDK